MADHDTVFGILSNERRRLAIEVLDARDRALSLGELAEEIAARENETTPAAITSAERKCVYNALYQTHLSKLADAGAVSFDDGRDAIRLGDRADVFLRHLRLESPSMVDRAWTALGGLVGGSA